MKSIKKKACFTNLALIFMKANLKRMCGGRKWGGVSCEFKPMKHRRKSTGRVLGKMFTFTKEQGTYKELDPFPPFCFWSL